MFVLPPLHRDRIRQVAACVHIDLKDRQDIRNALASREGALVARVKQEGHENILVRRLIDVEEDSGHFHIEAAVESALGLGLPADDELATVLEDIPELSGGKFGTTAWGRMRVAVADIPPHGAVATLLGTETGVGDFDLSLTGSTLAVSGDGPFNELRWWLTGDSGVIGVEVTAWDEMNIDQEILVRVAAITSVGVKVLVLEENDDDDRDETSSG